MTPSEAQAQLDKLDERLGKGQGAASERYRLGKLTKGIKPKAKRTRKKADPIIGGTPAERRQKKVATRG